MSLINPEKPHCLLNGHCSKLNNRFCVEILKLFTSLRTKMLLECYLVLRLMQDFPKFDIFSETPASTSILKKSYLVPCI